MHEVDHRQYTSSLTVPACLQLADASGNALGVCSSAIVGGGSSGVVVLGTNFLRAYYAVFKVNGSNGTAQVGFAPSTSASTSVGGR